MCNMLLALLFPTSGLMRGLNAIARGVRFGKSELDKACRAGGLCVVIRNSNWRPRKKDRNFNVVLGRRESYLEAQRNDFKFGARNFSNGTDDHVENAAEEAAFKVYHPTWLKESQRWWIFFDTIWKRATVNTLLFDIHGTYRLPPGYSFAVLPRNAIVVPRISNVYGVDHDEKTSVFSSSTLTTSPFQQRSDIASSGSVLKIIASILQLLFSYYTVYQHNGDQVHRWGCVSFFVMPLPYAVMSVCNGFSHLLTPDYARLYMVHSEIMDEAKEAGGAFEGVVGRVIPLIGPVKDNGYRDGFATTWKGISPRAIKRAIGTAVFRLFQKRRSRRTLTPAICTSFSEGSNDSCIMQMQSGEDEDRKVYRISSPPTNDEEVLDQVLHDAPIDTARKPLAERLADYRKTTILYQLYSYVRHPQRTWNSFKEWNSNPTPPLITYDLNLFVLYGIYLLLWAAFHPSRTKTAVSRWTFKSIFLPAQEKAADQTAIYYQSCSRFQRYDDPVPQKYSATAIMNISNVSSAPATPDINFPSITSFILTEEITWSSCLLPVLFGLVLSSVHLSIIAILSHFHPGSSSTTQRVIILLWWSSGSIIGLIMPLLDVTEILVCIFWLPIFISEQIGRLFLPNFLSLIAYITWGVFVASIWGFVIVGQILGEWGSCRSLY